MRKVFIFIVSTLITLSSFAQEQTATTSRNAKQSKTKKTPEDYKMSGYGITINTNSGLLGGFVYRSSKAISTWGDHPINRYFSVEIVNVKHPKEKTDQLLSTGGGIIADKMNYLFVLRPQYGREVFFFKKYGEEGVGVSGILAGGPSLGIEKPYYIKYQGGNNPLDVQTVPYDPAIYTDPNRIVGTGSFLQGLGSSKLIPGVHLKAGINLDLNTFGNSLTGFEIGFLAEYLSRKPQIMAFTSNQQFFTSGYLTVYFGSKKEKKSKQR